MNKLILGLAVFFAGHSISLLAPDWRNRIVERIGRRTWQAGYAAFAFFGLYLLIAGYGAARHAAAVLYLPPPWLHYVTVLMMLPVFPLALASVLPGNISARTRHPLLLATMLWSVAHLLTIGSVAKLLLFGIFLVWAVAVRVSLGRRPPRPVPALPSSRVNDAIAVLGGLALYAAFILWLHARWVGVPLLVAG